MRKTSTDRIQHLVLAVKALGLANERVRIAFDSFYDALQRIVSVTPDDAIELYAFVSIMDKANEQLFPMEKHNKIRKLVDQLTQDILDAWGK